jgi:two-component system response regulator MprA
MAANRKEQSVDMAKVLVADDNEVFRKVAGRVLEGAGYEVRFATDGLDTLRQVEEERPDVVVLDVMMPEMDGVTVCRQLKARAESERPIVIVVTAVEDAGDPAAGQVCGADDYLIKPFRWGELSERVDVALRARV